MLLSDRRALVTGGSRGIGRGIAVALAKHGASVAVHHRANPELAAETAAEVRAHGGESVTIAGDLARPEDVARIFDEASAALGRLDIVVLNAAAYDTRAIVDFDLDHYHAIFDVNVRGTVLCLAEAARRVVDDGRIIVISSTGAGGSSPGMAAYHAGKAAVEHFVKVLAREIGHRGVTVNAVSPGATRTDMLAKNTPQVIEGAAAHAALGRLGEVEDVADFVALVASDGARWVTGQVIAANGGIF